MKLNLLRFYAPAHRLRALTAGALLIMAIAITDWRIRPNLSLGFLYLFPLLAMSGFCRMWEMLAAAAGCTLLREVFSPFAWGPETVPRLLLVFSAFAGSGLWIRQLVAQRRQAADADEQLRVLVENSPAAILTADSQGRILLSNTAARRLLGYNGSLEGRSIGEHFPALSAALGERKPDSHFRTILECAGRRRNGEAFWAQVCFSTHRTSSGMRVSAVVWDGSERLRDREAAGLKTLMTGSQVLVGAILHEVRNLAGAAVMAHANLKRLPLLEGHEDFQALGTLVQGLQKVAASELRPAAASEGLIADVHEVLEELRVIIQPQFRGSRTEIEWQVETDLPLVKGDHHGLLQALLNLAQNSQRALQEASDRRVVIRAAVEAGAVKIRFWDSGTGVAIPDRLFEPFQTGAGGAGLGLYISRAILRSYGGDLSYEPQPRGSEFVLLLAPAGHNAR